MDKIQEWRKALEEANCLKLKNLLKDTPDLVLQGWEKNLAPEEEYQKGRFALHVGASRGCPELVDLFIHTLSKQVWGKGKLVVAEENAKECLELGVFLAAKDPHYKLDALAMAVFHGHLYIIEKLMTASNSCLSNPYEIKSRDIRNSAIWSSEFAPLEKLVWEMSKEDFETQNTSEEGIEQHAIHSPDSVMAKVTNLLISKEQIEKLKRENPNSRGLRSLERITENVTAGLSDEERKKVSSEYDRNCNLNFLPRGLYLFHSTFTFMKYTRVGQKVRQLIFSEARERRLVHFLLELKDGRGRTALHAAIQEGSSLGVIDFLEFLDTVRRVFTDFTDRIGRTPLHWAAALGRNETVLNLVGRNPKEWWNVRYTYNLSSGSLGRSTLYEFIMKIAERNGYKADPARRGDPIHALHLAIMHNHVHCLEALGVPPNRHPNRYQEVSSPNSKAMFNVGIGALQLATMVESAPMVKRLLEDGRAPRDFQYIPREGESREDKVKYLVFHIAAFRGCFDLIKLFLDHGLQQDDLFLKDDSGNTALHYVMLGINKERHLAFEFYHHLFHYVSFDQIEEKKREKNVGEMKGCVELLLQNGFHLNSNNDTPKLGHNAPPEFLSWWYKKLTNEILVARKMQITAANAIMIVATLVATASFVGPLQPPLNYVSEGSGIYDGIQGIYYGQILVRIFMVCDTLSLLLAVAAIMMALVPSLPIPRQSARAELERTRRIVNFSVAFLFPSIVCLLMAFAVASIEVTPKDEAWKYGGLTIVAVAACGLLSVIVISFFLFRLIVVFDGSVRVRKFYDKYGL